MEKLLRQKLQEQAGNNRMQSYRLLRKSQGGRSVDIEDFERALKNMNLYVGPEVRLLWADPLPTVERGVLIGGRGQRW
jgi:nitrate/nitrite-specific signal transduction histidine kinase